MRLDEFLASATDDSDPPARLSESLRALWHAQRGDWERAHEIAQAIPTAEGSWIHAHLHREEGDLGNARYWYARAGRPESHESIEDERREIIRTLLQAAD